jgi:hypothetical protein
MFIIISAMRELCIPLDTVADRDFLFQMIENAFTRLHVCFSCRAEFANRLTFPRLHPAVY